MRNFKVSGSRYSEVPTYYDWDAEHKYPNYESLKETETEWEIEALDLDDAIRWLAENHPEYFMGSFISATELEDGHQYLDFCANAVPCEYWGDGNYETEERRVSAVKDFIKKVKFGVKDSGHYDDELDWEDEWEDEEEEKDYDNEEFLNYFEKKYDSMERAYM